MESIVMAPPHRADGIGLLDYNNVKSRRAHRDGTCQPRGAGTDDDGVGILQYALRKRTYLLPPHLFRDIDREPQLRPLLLLGEDIALFGRGKAALRRYRELIQRHELARLLQPPLDIVLILELASLRGDDADHDNLVAFRQIPQRLEAAGPLGIVFEKIAVVTGAGQHGLRNRLITARRNPGRAEIAATNMRGDRHVRRPFGDRVIDDAGVNFLQVVGALAARSHLVEFILRAEIGPYRVVELQIAATGVVERLYRLAIGLGEVLEKHLDVGIDFLRDRLAAAAEMQHRG